MAGRPISNVKAKHSNHSKIPARKSVRGFATGRTLTTRKQPLASKESNNLVGKFVLPTRSVHSSRVIKPNKRFINMELSDPRTIKKRVICKRHVIKAEDDKTKTVKTKCSSSDGDKESNKSGAEEPSSAQASNSRIVLRQARLQLHTQTPSGPEGPFSSSSTATTSPPGTVTCGVCGAVRFYRFVKQARKFKIYSCESCRKFISKMIKRQSCAKNMTVSTLVCHKGQGMCHVPPIVRSQQWKLIRCAYKARCPACWLKMCLRSFHMPMTLKNSLAQLLPKNMQGPELLFNSSLPLLSWQAAAESSERATENLDQQRCTRLKSAKILEKPPPAPAGSEIKRQKIDLKGPRVKHVCRSASIVLGQPLATFPSDTEKKDVAEAKAEAKTLEVKVSESRVETPIETASLASSDNSLDAFVADEIKETGAFKQPSHRSDSSGNIIRRDRDKYQKQNSSSSGPLEVILVSLISSLANSSSLLSINATRNRPSSPKPPFQSTSGRATIQMKYAGAASA